MKVFLSHKGGDEEATRIAKMLRLTGVAVVMSAGPEDTHWSYENADKLLADLRTADAVYVVGKPWDSFGVGVEMGVAIYSRIPVVCQHEPPEFWLPLVFVAQNGHLNNALRAVVEQHERRRSG